MPKAGRGRKRATGGTSGQRQKAVSTSDSGSTERDLATDNESQTGNASGLGRSVIDFEDILRRSQMIDIPEQSAHVQANRQHTGTAGHGTESGLTLPTESDLGQTNQGQNVDSVRCSNDELYVHIPKSLRLQICKGEYVNLALLLKGEMELQEFCSGSTLKLSGDGAIESKPKICKDKIQSIEKWTDAFILYMSIYITVHAGKAGEMLHYMHLIREAAIRQGGFSWRSYDEQFRIRQAASPQTWAVINNDLWWRCMQLKEAPVSAGNTSLLQGATSPVPHTSSTQNSTLSRTCIDFNKGQCRWPLCKFPHLCSGCGLPHGVWSCPSGAGPDLGQRVQAKVAPRGASASFRFPFYRQAFRSPRGRWPRDNRGVNRGFGYRQRPY